MTRRIIEFYGQGCPDYVAIVPEIEKLEKEEDVEIEKLEVWHNEENHNRMENLKRLYDQECDGKFEVPSYYEEETERMICNPRSYENIKKWLYQT